MVQAPNRIFVRTIDTYFVVIKQLSTSQTQCSEVVLARFVGNNQLYGRLFVLKLFYHWHVQLKPSFRCVSANEVNWIKQMHGRTVHPNIVNYQSWKDYGVDSAVISKPLFYIV